MSTPFQNRLVGSVIVAAIAIIFLPDLLDGNKKKYNAEFENIPQAPEIELNAQVRNFPEEKLKPVHSSENEIVEVEQDAIVDISDKKQEEIIASIPNITENDKVKIQTLTKDIAETKNITLAPIVKNTLPDKINIKEAWVIQLGSFRHKKNVMALIDKLTYHGYTTFTKPIVTKNGTLTKVFIGPDINKTALENKIAPLKLLTNVKGKVTRFSPAKM